MVIWFSFASALSPDPSTCINQDELEKRTHFRALIYNQYTHQSSHLFRACRSSRVEVLSKSPCF